jgi:uncharacterized small protein (DUF1192 family)
MEIEEEPRPKHRLFSPPKLDGAAAEELRAYIGDLRTEIARVEAELQRKQAHLTAAAAFFKPTQ